MLAAARRRLSTHAVALFRSPTSLAFAPNSRLPYGLTHHDISAEGCPPGPARSGNQAPCTLAISLWFSQALWRGRGRPISTLVPKATLALAPPARQPKPESTSDHEEDQTAPRQLRSRAAGRGNREGEVSKDVGEYWSNILSQIDTEDLKHMVDAMDERHPVGMSKEWVKDRGSVNCYGDFVDFKKRYPKFVVLVQVGDFYETCGIDALVLAHWLKYRITSQHTNVPKAGFPLKQLKPVVRRLNTYNFSVVVVTQTEPERPTASKLGRELLGLSTPARPWYYNDNVFSGDEDMDGGDVFISQRRLVGVWWSKSGYVLAVLLPDVEKVEATYGLTKEGLLTMLHATGVAPPLFLHKSLEDAPDADMMRGLRALAKRAMGDHERMTQEDPEQGFVQQVKQHLPDYLKERDLPVVRQACGKGGDRPQPLYTSTMQQLGLDNNAGNRNLLNMAVPTLTPPLCKSLLQQLLMVPPPPRIAWHVAAAVKHLQTTNQALRKLDAELPGSKVTEALDSLRADAPFFRELKGMLDPLLLMLDQPQHAPLWAHLLPFALWSNKREDEAGSLTIDHLQSQLARAQQLIHEVVVWEPQGVSRGGTSSMEEEDSGPEDGSSSPATTATGKSSKLPGMDKEQVFRRQEQFRRAVREEKLQGLCNAVDTARARLLAELEQVLALLLKQGASTDNAKKLPSIRAVDDGYIAIHVPRGYHDAWKRLYSKQSIKIEGRRSKASDFYVTATLDGLNHAYVEACKAAKAQADVLLKQLSEELRLLLPDLILGCKLSVSKEALQAHVTYAKERTWVQADMFELAGSSSNSTEGATTGQGAGAPRGMQLEGFWPYWMEQEDAVLNDVQLDRMTLLTGPNMGGKSTVLRSICAVALLANCGLMVPCTAARVPCYDAFLLRNFSGDSPVEGKSSFALEMQEIRMADEQCTERSLILVDELGKGTEWKHGTALAGALVKEWVEKGFVGMFASHLHLLVPITVKAQLHEQGLLDYMCMETTGGLHDPVNPRVRPTWKLQGGVNLTSLAFEVAEDNGLRPKLIQEARALEDGIEDGKFVIEPSYARLAQRAEPSASSQPGAPRGSPPAAHAAAGAVSTPGKSLADAQAVLQQVVLEVLGLTPEALLDQQAHVKASLTVPEFQTLNPEEQAPPSHTRRGAVYVVQWANGLFYCGETADVNDRFKEHSRPTKSGKSATAKAKGPGACMTYAVLPNDIPASSSNKAVPDRKVFEKRVIKALEAAGFPLTSNRDKGHRRLSS